MKEISVKLTMPEIHYLTHLLTVEISDGNSEEGPEKSIKLKEKLTNGLFDYINMKPENEMKEISELTNKIGELAKDHTYKEISTICKLSLASVSKHLAMYRNSKTSVKTELDKAVGNVINQIDNEEKNMKKNLYKINSCCKDLLKSMINKESGLDFDIGFSSNNKDGNLLIKMEDKIVRFCPFCGFEIAKL